MKKFSAFFKWISSLLWKPKVILVLFLLAVAAWPAWLVHSAFSADGDVAADAGAVTEDNATDALAGLFHTDGGRLFGTNWPSMDSALFVNTRSKSLIFQPRLGSAFITIGYEGKDKMMKTPVAASRGAFDSLMDRDFRLKDYTALVKDSGETDSEEMLKMGAAIGASPDYTRELLASGRKDIRTILFSLLYNMVLDGGPGHILTRIEGGKIKAVTEKNYTVDMVDQSMLTEAIRKIQQGVKSDVVRYINKRYDSLHPGSVSADTAFGDSITGGKDARGLQEEINELFGKGSIQLGVMMPFPFVYVNFKKDILYCGQRPFPYNARTLQAADDNTAATLFDGVFKLDGVKGGDADVMRDLANQAGFGSDSLSIPHGISNAQSLFRALLTHLLEHPSVYFIANKKLTEFGQNGARTLPPDYGTFDMALLRTGITDLRGKMNSLPDMTIVRRFGDIPLSIYVALAVLSLTAVLLVFYGSRKNREVGELQQQLEKVIEEAKEAAAQPKVEQPALKQRSSGGMPVSNVIKQDPLQELFQQTARKKTEGEKIEFLLGKFDASSFGGSTDRKLAGEYERLRKARENYDLLGQLLVTESPGDIYHYLDSEIEKLVMDNSLQSIARFAALFTTSQKRRMEDTDKLLEEHERMEQSLAVFYGKSQRLPDQKLLGRMALVCWSAELATSLIRIKHPEFEGFEFDKIKQDQLKLIFSQYFFTLAAQPDKTEADLAIKFAEGSARVDEYNKKLDDPISHLSSDDESHVAYLASLTNLMQKIKLYDKTKVVFDRLYHYFVREFTNRIDDLRFTKSELNPEDRSWLFQALFNIAFHAADYTEYFVKGDPEYNHPNVELLLNELDYRKDPPREFIEGDLHESSRAANAVAKAARFVGVKRLDFLVDKFHIKPTQTA